MIAFRPEEMAVSSSIPKAIRSLLTKRAALHFKLAVTNEKSAENYENAQGTYVPQLDPSRDKMLMDILPDYLVEEIYFPRPQAAKFYARVFKALTDKAS